MKWQIEYLNFQSLSLLTLKKALTFSHLPLSSVFWWAHVSVHVIGCEKVTCKNWYL